MYVDKSACWLEIRSFGFRSVAPETWVDGNVKSEFPFSLLPAECSFAVGADSPSKCSPYAGVPDYRKPAFGSAHAGHRATLTEWARPNRFALRGQVDEMRLCHGAASAVPPSSYKHRRKEIDPRAPDDRPSARVPRPAPPRGLAPQSRSSRRQA